MSKYKFGLRIVKVENIQPNPNNPRGDSVRDNDDQFQYLKRSIKELGLIVPLVIQKIADKKDKYVLLDGERRYYAVKELGIKEVPAHVLSDNVNANEGKNLMFHIHTTRLQWEPYQQCKALEPMYEDLKKKFNDNESYIAKQLTISTGTNKRTVDARLNFLRWPSNLKQLVYNEKPELYYTIVEIEAQIIQPALKNFSSFFDTVKVDEVREFLLRKYLGGVVHAAIEARQVTKMLQTSHESKGKYSYALRLFNKLINNINYTFENAHDDFIEKYPEADEEFGASFRKANLSLSKTIAVLDNFNFEHLNDKEKHKFTQKLIELKKIISQILPEADDDSL